MKVIIAGSRTIHSKSDVIDAIWASGFEVDTIVCGCAIGVDTVAGHQYAREVGIPVEHHPAHQLHPLERNIRMAEAADALIAVWDGVSRGTAHMMSQMRLREKPVYVHRVSAPSAAPRTPSQQKAEERARLNELKGKGQRVQHEARPGQRS